MATGTVKRLQSLHPAACLRAARLTGGSAVREQGGRQGPELLRLKAGVQGPGEQGGLLPRGRACPLRAWTPSHSAPRALSAAPVPRRRLVWLCRAVGATVLGLPT